MQLDCKNNGPVLLLVCKKKNGPFLQLDCKNNGPFLLLVSENDKTNFVKITDQSCSWPIRIIDHFCGWFVKIKWVRLVVGLFETP